MSNRPTSDDQRVLMYLFVNPGRGCWTTMGSVSLAIPVA